MHWAFHPALVVALILSVLLDAWGATVHVNVTDLKPLAATPWSLAAFEGMACAERLARACPLWRFMHAVMAAAGDAAR